MNYHPTFPVAVHLLIIQGDDVLLLRRFNTGWADGYYSLVAGHVEHGETATQAIVREAKEEIDIEILQANLMFEHCISLQVQKPH